MAYTTINKSSDYFNTKLYTGNGSNGHAITGVGFQPDWVWLKNRSAGTAHVVVDAVRGNNKVLSPNNTEAESTTNANKDFRSFDSDGFTVDTNENYGSTNSNGANIAAWNWKAGTTSGITQGGASITPSSYSINATSGFSIIKWTGTNANATVPHGLGVAPKMIIIRRLESSSSWVVYHHSVGNTKRLTLDSDAAESGASANWFNNTSPTANVFSVGTDGGSNGSTDNYIAYCFAEKKGFSKFNSYTGNGNADGTFVYTGFKPAFVLTKYSTSTSGWWQLQDNKRDVDNPNSHALFANVADSEYNLSNYHTDYLSNGFKLRNTQAGGNTNGGTYIYMAFAEAPLVGSNGVTAKAR